MFSPDDLCLIRKQCEISYKTFAKVFFLFLVLDINKVEGDQILTFGSLDNTDIHFLLRGHAIVKYEATIRSSKMDTPMYILDTNEFFGGDIKTMGFAEEYISLPFIVSNSRVEVATGKCSMLLIVIVRWSHFSCPIKGVSNGK